MLFELGTFGLVVAVGAVCVFGYMFGTALDSLIGEDGFGALGNMIVLVGGFFVSILVANRFGYKLDTPLLACVVGLIGSFCALSSLTLVKAGIARL